MVLPEEARVRRYTVYVNQYGDGLYVAVQGALRGYDAFTGRLEPDGLAFDLTWYEDRWYVGGYYPQLAEELTTSNVLVIAGTAVATPSTDRIVGVLDGSFELHKSFPGGNLAGPAKPDASCPGRHQFQFTR
jgi:hypothetical protein